MAFLFRYVVLGYKVLQIDWEFLESDFIEVSNYSFSFPLDSLTVCIVDDKVWEKVEEVRALVFKEATVGLDRGQKPYYGKAIFHDFSAILLR